MADDQEEPVGNLPPPPSFQSVLVEVLKQLATATTDLHQLSCPAVMLNGVSLLEYGKHWGDHPDLFAKIGKEERPIDRLIAVVRWYISTLYGSFIGRTEKSGGFERKPYNPILGEQFRCYWPDQEGGTTKLISEQVGHHPPVAAFQLSNQTTGVYLNGHCGQRTRFTGTAIQVEQTGCLFVFVQKYAEEYAISLPELYLRGLVTGAPFVEITGETLIVSSKHKLAAKIRFLPKPWFSGEYNLVEGIIYNDDTKDILYEVWGKWSEKTWIQSKELDPQDTHLANIESGVVDHEDPLAFILFDTEASPIERPFVPRDQSPLESRQVWKTVTEALINGDSELASAMKNQIEEEQRALRKERAVNGIQWMPSLFTYLPEFFVTKSYESNLAQISGPNISTESLIRLRALDLSENGLEQHSSDSDAASSVPDNSNQNSIEQRAVEVIKFNGRWVSYEFMDVIAKK